MTLALEIEYLAGVAFAAQGPDTDAPDWPPQPDRVFSALVATWAARGQLHNEAAALRWLEQQTVPGIVASDAEPRTAPAVYVPPNDFETTAGRGMPRVGSKQYRKASGVVPSLRPKKERRFPASRPQTPLVRFYWNIDPPDEDTLHALDRLAADTAYVGHSASLTRCRFLLCDAYPADSQPPARRIYEGRLDELRKGFERFVASGGRVGRPHPGDRAAPSPKAGDETPRSYFSTDWLVLEHASGEMPDIRAAALLCKEIRDALLSGYRQCGKGDSIPALVSGHTADGGPVRAPHLAIVPLAFAGYPYADGRVLGFALIPPRGSGLLEDATFLQAMRRIAPYTHVHERRELLLRYFSLTLSPTKSTAKRSLDADEYTRRARTFATVTPIILDHHLKQSASGRQNEVVAQIKSACQNIGLPAPEISVPDRHSAIEGAPSAQPSGHAPAWTRWRLPTFLASRLLTHAVIRFPCHVEGPVILGAGRFVGLGLCRPIGGPQESA